MSDTVKLPSVQIFYEKNPLYRTIYADGLIGGETPTGSISLSFYASRYPIPKSTSHEILADNTLDPKGKNSDDSKLGIIREIEVGIYLNKKTAKDIYDFLKKIIESNE